MVELRLTAVLITIGVLQMCTANPSSVEKEYKDAAKLYPDTELERAKNVGLTEKRLNELRSHGLTFEEIIEFHELRKTYQVSMKNVTFKFMTSLCKILDSNHKTAESYTNDQEAHLPNFIGTMTFLADYNQVSFGRTTVCAYISQPNSYDMEADAFGLPLVPYMEIRFLKMKAQKASGVERVIIAKEMCCVYKRQDKRVFLKLSKFNDLPDGELNEFGEQWKKFETANTLKSLENVCDFLRPKDSVDECELGDPIV